MKSLHKKQEFSLTTETQRHGVLNSLCLRGSSLFGFGLFELGSRIWINQKSGQADCANQIHFHNRKESGADNRIVRQGIHAVIILYTFGGSRK